MTKVNVPDQLSSDPFAQDRRVTHSKGLGEYTRQDNRAESHKRKKSETKKIKNVYGWNAEYPFPFSSRGFVVNTLNAHVWFSFWFILYCPFTMVWFECILNVTTTQ